MNKRKSVVKGNGLGCFTKQTKHVTVNMHMYIHSETPPTPIFLVFVGWFLDVQELKFETWVIADR